MIVAALIALLSGIAIFSINEFYNGQLGKITIAETSQIGTALSFAQQDLQFYPRYQFLNAARTQVLFNESAGVGAPDPAYVVAGIDYWGFSNGIQPQLLPRIQNKWAGPYLGASSTRNRSNRGKGGVCKMRLPDVYYTAGVPVGPAPTTPDYSLVDWPADPYGNPYMLYQFKSGLDTNNKLTPFFLTGPTEEADILNAVVSYGRNGFPGGTSETLDLFSNQYLRPGALFLPGDIVPGGPAQFTLRVCNPDSRIPTNLQLINNTQVHQDVINSIDVGGLYNLRTGQVGVTNGGSDDVLFVF